MNSKEKTHRFKFSESFSQTIEEFTRIHKFNNPKDFKESWIEWKDENNHIIEKELKYLQTKGYQGNIYDKIYKSIRYYHKNKSNIEKKAKKRKPYIGLERSVLDAMDLQITRYMENRDCKPSDGFNIFMDSLSKEMLNKQVLMLKSHGYDTKEDILNKFKKTYKNRYFIKQKKK